MKIGIDLDEVLLDFIGPLNDFYNQCYGTKFSRDDYTDYALWNIWNCSQNEANKFVDFFLRSRYYFLVRPLPDAKRVVERLSLKHELCAITARPLFNRSRVINSVDRYFGKLIKEIHFSGNVFNDLHQGASKAEICLVNDIEVMIEDSLEYAEQCASAGIKSFLLTTPWNVKKTTSDKITRLKNLSDIIFSLNEKS